MQFSIITPSFRSARWLKLCIPSVADQSIEHEHIVQDSVSDDGTLEWLPQDGRVKPFIEKDLGMYDAVNRGLRKAKGEILAYLNADEQYLPGALSAVWQFFERNPDVELVFADAVVVNEDGSFNCFRKIQLPWACDAMTGALCTLTCSMFFRRSLIDRRQHYFNDGYRYLGDVDWVVRALESGVRMKVLRHYTSIFTETGENLSLNPNVAREQEQMRNRAPAWARGGAPIIKFAYRVTRLLNGGLRQRPFSYSIYTQSSPEQRVNFHVEKPTALWYRKPISTPGGS